MDPHSLPFEVGQEVEIRSFIQGYRGAWFRCKINEIRLRNNELWHAMKYTDFLDQKITWTKVYQKQKVRHSKDVERTLMVRPCYPSVYRENQMPNMNDISEVVVIVNDVWELGDSVDWLTDGCYWSGTITEKLGDEKYKIELPAPPVGEGSSYEVFCKDLRPSLDWSISEGWKLCNAKESKYHSSSARIIRPLNQGEVAVAGDSQNVVDNIVDHGPKRSSCSDNVSGQYVQDASAQMPVDNCSLKKMKIDQNVSLNSTSSDTTEAAILDLEELICRVKWLNNILQFGLEEGLVGRTCWKFVEHLAQPK